MEQKESNKLIAEFMGLPKYICDNCGAPEPKLLNEKISRLTECCSTYDKDHANCFYKTTDNEGRDVYSIGKTWFRDIPNYHSSWNELMPVCYKLKTLETPEHGSF